MKKIKTHRGFGIYERSDQELRRALDKLGCIIPRYEVYLPGESPDSMDAAEWDSDDLDECINFIDHYND